MNTKSLFNSKNFAVCAKEVITRSLLHNLENCHFRTQIILSFNWRNYYSKVNKSNQTGISVKFEDNTVSVQSGRCAVMKNRACACVWPTYALATISTCHQTTRALVPRCATHPSTLLRPILVSTETSPLTILNPFSAVQWPRYRNPHTHTRVHGRNGQIKKNETKNISRNGEWVPDRDNYISAVYSSSVRSATKNTDAIFTAYVIEHWRSQRCVRERRERRPRPPKRRRNI